MSVVGLATAAVKTTTGGSINAGIWTLVGVIVTTIGAVLLAVIKQWGPWRRDASLDRNADFERLRAEIADLKQQHRDETLSQNGRIEKLEGDVETARQAATAANEHSMRSDAKLHTALTACELLLGLVEREMPQASEIGLVKRLLAQAASDDLGIGSGMRKIAMMKGVGE